MTRLPVRKRVTRSTPKPVPQTGMALHTADACTSCSGMRHSKAQRFGSRGNCFTSPSVGVEAVQTALSRDS